MKNYFTLIFIFLFFNEVIPKDNSDSKLSIKIDLNKNTYQKFESIFGDIKLYNISNENVNIKSLFNLKVEEFLRINCQGKNGKKYSGNPVSSTIFIDPDYKLVMSPNDSLLITFNLLHLMGEYDKTQLHTFYLPEGEYKVTATFCPDAFDLPISESEVRDKCIISKEIIFNITNKESSYENEDLKFLNHVMKEKSELKDYRLFKNKMEHFISKYPDSKFLDIAYLNLLLTLRINLKDSDSFYQWLKKAYEKFYNDFFFGEFIILWIPVENRLHLDNNEKLVSELYKDFTKRYKNSKGMNYLQYKEKKYRELEY